MALGKKISLGASILRSKITGKAVPAIVNWAITGRCNLRCKHCYGGYGAVQNEELPLEIIKSTVDELKKMGTRRITIEGGEPLVRIDIGEIIEYISAKKIEMSLCTNGVLLDRFINIVKQKVDLLVLSLEGSEKYHDSLRGEGNFKKVMHAIELARENNVRTLLFACLIDENLVDIDFLVSLAKEYGVSVTFNIAVAKIKKEGGREELAKKPDDDYRKALKRILELKKKGAPVYYSENNFIQAINWPTFTKERYYQAELDALDKSQKRTMIPCFAGKNFCYIECTGDVYPCYQTVGILETENVKKAGFKKAFDHLSKMAYCKRCYNVTLSELNLQCGLDLKSVAKVIQNYGKK